MNISETPKTDDRPETDLAQRTGGGGDTPPPSAPPRRRRRGIGRSGRWEIALLAGPAVIFFVGFVIIPVILAAYYGFFNWHGYGPATDFIGLKNYVTILTDPDFQEALGHNAFIVVMSLLIQGPVALLLALLLNRKMRGQSLIRVLIFVPYVIAEVVVGTGFSLMLATNGALNGLLDDLGLSGLTRDWLSDPSIAIWTLVAILTWKYVGFAVILFLAGLQGIPDELYEAAAIDGATGTVRFWRITLPMLGPTLLFVIIVLTTRAFQAYGEIDLLTDGGPRPQNPTTTITYLTYGSQSIIANDDGLQAATAVLLFVVLLVLSLLQLRGIGRRVHYAG